MDQVHILNVMNGGTTPRPASDVDRFTTKMHIYNGCRYSFSRPKKRFFRYQTDPRKANTTASMTG
jgi:hypothetical protein